MHPFNYLYPGLFITRIAIFVAVLAYWHKDGFIQMLVLTITSCAMLGFVAAYKPFKN